MSARPPLPPSQEPFDTDEAALARAYRALPGGEPAPALDARILAQARAAVARPKRRPQPWFLGAGFGAAAAAVMAAGVAWQLGWLGGIPGAITTPGSAQRSDASAPRRVESAPATAEETIDIDYVREERKAKEDAPPAAKPADLRRQNAATPPAPAAAPPPPAPPAPPAPAQEAPRDEPAPLVEQPKLSAPEPQPFPAESASADTALGVTAAGASAKREGRAEQEAASGPERGRLAKQLAALPHWTDDERLDPEAWLERIRERVRRTDRQSAEYSLRRFVQVHPQRTVPRELQRLLVE